MLDTIPTTFAMPSMIVTVPVHWQANTAGNLSIHTQSDTSPTEISIVRLCYWKRTPKSH